MAFLQVNFFSQALRQAASMNVLVPNAGPGPFPVFYLLHGLSDDHTIWQRRTSIERYVEPLPLIVVMPTTARGFYTNAATAPGLAYEDHIVKDTVGFMDRMFPTIKSRAGRAIGGLSMGGYGAVKLALKHPSLFCSAHSHSGALLGAFRKPNETPRLGEDQQCEFDAIFGADTFNSPNDPLHLAALCPQAKRPALHIDCGKQDFLLQANRTFHKHLLKNKYAHIYKEHPGEHNWAYWDQHIQEALAFHCKNLGIK